MEAARRSFTLRHLADMACAFLQATTNPLGLLVAVSAILCTAVYQIWAGSKQEELGAGSMQLMHQLAPQATCRLALLLVGVEPLGLPRSTHSPGEGTILGCDHTPLAVAAILTTAVLGLLVSLSTFLVTGATSAVTCNVVRDTARLLSCIAGMHATACSLYFSSVHITEACWWILPASGSKTV